MLKILVNRREQLLKQLEEIQKQKIIVEKDNEVFQIKQLIKLIDLCMIDILKGEETPDTYLHFYKNQFIEKTYKVKEDVILITCLKCLWKWEEGDIKYSECPNCHKNLKEKFAEECHKSWSNWATILLLGKCGTLDIDEHCLNINNNQAITLPIRKFSIISESMKKAWKNKISTQYEELCKFDKDEYRNGVNIYFKILSNYFKQKKEEVDKKVKEEKGWDDTNLYVKGKLEGRWETYKELEEYFSNH